MNRTNAIRAESATDSNFTTPENLQLITKENVFTSEEKSTLEDLFEELFANIDENKIIESDSPEILFSKFLWKIKYLEGEIDKIKSASEQLIAEVEQWKVHKTEQKLKQIEYLSRQMEYYLRQKEMKTLSLPNGSIALRKQPDRIEITDEELFYQKADESVLRRVPESYAPDMKAIRDKIKKTGEILPGIQVTEQESKFSYKLN